MQNLFVQKQILIPYANDGDGLIRLMVAMVIWYDNSFRGVTWDSSGIRICTGCP